MSTETDSSDASAPKQLSIQDAVSFASNLHRNGHLKDARTLYSRVLELEPEHPDALHFMGVLEHQQGRNEAALRLMRRSVELVPQHAGFHTNLGNLLFDGARFEEAEREYREALSLSPERPEVLNNLGVLCKGQNRLDEAEQHFLQAIDLSPDFIDARNNLSRLYVRMGRTEDSIAQAMEAMKRDPGNASTREVLAYAYARAGQLDDAIGIYRDWLEDEPDNPKALHHLAACTGQDVPERASDAYIQSVFDSFSHSFDAKLAVLEYQAPKLIVDKTVAYLGLEPAARLDILDAGCGTGLCGPLLAPYAKRLTGVDLSQGMLVKARERTLYDALHHAELTDFIRRRPAEFDLIVSADTLVYFGEIGPVLEAASSSLRPGGHLGFSVEALEGTSDDYRLQPNGRYAHSKTYLERTLLERGFDLRAMDRETLRLEGGTQVMGWVVIAQRSHRIANQ
ncbi:Methyltransferase type 12 [Thiorhodococcus drewsii AZ1]|uniref:Methyltransferase type 12 n=1 Tax=Thiorhodococcus drewsii AZ1 TaxID=765913 RepID=G2E3G7_9GAMM|nr:tetratricopeptide repeat protein [Thiorhodococcus drewsii]EGV30356.1 Methyltransferase type 12 [Thiorhodococcus drewsii AZ1]